MNGRRSSVMAKLQVPLAIVIAFSLLVLTQKGLIDTAPEKIEENKFSDFSNLPLSSAVPAYIGSLFLGAFRAIAVDMLWMEYSSAKRRNLFHEQLEIVELLTHLQPRNDETWAFLGWDFAYNIAHTAPSPDEEWKYIRMGFERWREGIRINRRSAKLHYELANALYHKACWDQGKFQEDYIDHFFNDRELQSLIFDSPSDIPSLPFEASRQWFAKTREVIRELSRSKKIEAEKLKYVVTAMGLSLQDSTMDIMIVYNNFHEALYHWHHGKFDDAERLLGATIRGIDALFAEYGNENISPFFRKMQNVVRKFRDALPVVKVRMGAPSQEGRLEILSLLEPVLLENSAVEDYYMFNWLSRIKQEAGGDRHEINDEADATTARWLNLNQPISDFTIAPTIGDVDVFLVVADDKKEAPEEYVPMAFVVKISSREPIGLKIVLLNPKKEVVASREGFQSTYEVKFVASDEGPYWICVTGPSDRTHWSPTSSYTIELVQKLQMKKD